MSMSTSVVLAALAQGLLGVALMAFGRWAVGAADTLIPAGLNEEERARRHRGLLLGARACQFIGLVLLLFAVATAIASLAGVQPTLRPQ